MPDLDSHDAAPSPPLEDQRKPVEQHARELGAPWWTRTTTPGGAGPVVTYDGPGWLLAGVLAAPVDMEALQAGEAKHVHGGYRLELGTPLTKAELLALGALVADAKMEHHTAPARKG